MHLLFFSPWLIIDVSLFWCAFRKCSPLAQAKAASGKAGMPSDSSSDPKKREGARRPGQRPARSGRCWVGHTLGAFRKNQLCPNQLCIYNIYVLIHNWFQINYVYMIYMYVFRNQLCIYNIHVLISLPEGQSVYMEQIPVFPFPKSKCFKLKRTLYGLLVFETQKNTVWPFILIQSWLHSSQQMRPLWLTLWWVAWLVIWQSRRRNLEIMQSKWSGMLGGEEMLNWLVASVKPRLPFALEISVHLLIHLVGYREASNAGISWQSKQRWSDPPGRRRPETPHNPPFVSTGPVTGRKTGDLVRKREGNTFKEHKE